MIDINTQYETSEEEKKFFRKNGFIKLKNIITILRAIRKLDSKEVEAKFIGSGVEKETIIKFIQA